MCLERASGDGGGWSGESRTRKVDLIVIGTIRSAPRGVISEALGEPCNPGELVLGPPSVCAGV